MNPLEKYIFTADEDDHKTRLDKFLSDKLDNVTRSRVQSLILDEAVSCNGQTVTNRSHKVKNGEEWVIVVPELKDSTMDPAPQITLNVAYEDEHLLIIDKQAGLTVHPGAGAHNDTMVNALLAHCGDSLSGIGGVQRPGIVHRLDRDTTGLMVVAKHDEAHVALSEKIATRELKRVYHTLVWGAPFPPVGTIKTYLDRSKKDRTKMVATKGEGKHAVTQFKVLETYGDNVASLVECRLDTGRTHQIRVHMHYKKHPLIGDQTYGQVNRTRTFMALDTDTQRTLKHFPRQALHSAYIAFTHPITGEFIERHSPPPPDMAALADTLKKL